ncbi:hypothetical protein CK203_087614 [Vitis vinifera]|uniref:Uncharacterized protein n=1 Tax=Vitis vinifera TaxID=29760 RepID=A0A438EZM6_VITVI|nr:hypothetical protein CK203_087614 [Vitis vinifera]
MMFLKKVLLLGRRHHLLVLQMEAAQKTRQSFSVGLLLVWICLMRKMINLNPAIDDLNLPQVPSDSENGERLATNVENSQVASTANGSCCSSDRNILMEDSKALRTSVNAGSAEEQPIMKPQRQSTRNRPLTTKALEALASGFLNTRRKRKGTEVQAEENPILRPSRRARSRVTGTPNCANPGTGMMDSKEANGADGVL